MRIVFMGTPGFAVLPLERLLLDPGNEVVAVYTQPDRPSGRGRRLVQSPVKEAALRLGLTVAQPGRLKTAEATAQLTDYKPDMIVVAAFGQILPPAVLEIPRHGCLNIHPSLLPKYRGASPIASAIMGGDEFTGVSIMLLDAGMDTGPVLTQAMIPISPQDNTGSLSGKLSLIAAHLLQEAMTGWLRGEISPRAQDDAAATYSSMMTKEEGEIDWSRPAVETWRRVRAFNPWPGCYTKWHGHQMKIIEAVPVPDEKSAGAGCVMALPGRADLTVIGTGDGALGILKIQMEGKRAMSAAEFIRGHQDFIGSVLPG